MALMAATALVVTACGSSHHGTTATTSAAQGLLQQGLTAEGAGQLDQARQDYLGVLKQDPTNKFAYYDLGVTYQQVNDVADAKKAYQDALKVDPQYKPALFNLAVLLSSTEPQTSISLYRQLLVINAKDATVHFNLGLVLKHVGQTAAGNAEIGTALKLQPSLASRLPASTTPSATTTVP